VIDEGAIRERYGPMKGLLNEGSRRRAQLDGRTYELGLDVADDQFVTANITRRAFHGSGNYTIAPSVIQS
jgi:hypothetical protein